jgi:DNA-binding MarR family transcriptional regulator
VPNELDRRPIGRSLGRTHKFVHALGDRRLAPIGASVTDFILLFHIDSADAPGLSQTEIARFSNMGGPALVRHLDRMERDGYVTRTRDASDRRIMRVTLTDQGAERLAEIAVVMAEGDRQLRSVITEEEADVLQRALDKIFAFVLRELYGDTNPTPTFTEDQPPAAVLAAQPTTRSKR